jgi:heat shock protein HtpX
MGKKLLSGFRLVILGCIVFLNWVLVGLFFSMLNFSDQKAGLLAFLVEGAFVALAFTPAGEAYFRKVNRLRPPLPQEEQVLRPVFERVAARCGLTSKPDLFVQRNRYPNALAVGTKTVAVTEGLLYGATVEELEAVLAHEVAHLLNGDTRVRLVAFSANFVGSVALWIMTAFMGFLGVTSIIFGEWNREVSGAGWLLLLLAWTIKLCVWVLTKILELSYLAVNRREEFAADEYAARHGFGNGLVSFLSRLPEDQPEGMLAALYASHPSPEARITRLMRLGG